jgi:glycogen synthase
MDLPAPTFKDPLLFVGPYPPVIGGTAAMLNRLVPALEERGATCRILNTRVGNAQRGGWERVRRLGFFLGLAARVLGAPERTVHCHAVNFANLLGHGFILLACRLAGKRSVITLHAGDLQRKLSRGRSRTIGRMILKWSHVVTTVTPELNTTVAGLGVSHSCFIANDLRYLPPGAEDSSGTLPDEVAAFIDSHSPVVVLVGAVDRPYGVDVLIRAIAQLTPTRPQIGALVIAFKSNNLVYEKEIADLIKTCGVQDAVFFPAPFPQIAEALKRSTVFVRPTLSDGDSIAVREALTLGVPVIASDVGFRPAGVQQFRSEDPADLARIIEETIHHPPAETCSSAEAETETLDRFFASYRLAQR